MANEELQGRVALVTGAGTGIGAAVAAHLSRLGAAVVLVGRRPEPLERVAAGLENESLVTPADVTDPDAVAEVVTAATDRFGHLDIVVNNAGTTRTGARAPHERRRLEHRDRRQPKRRVPRRRAAFRPLRDAARESGRHSKIVSVGSTLGSTAAR